MRSRINLLDGCDDHEAVLDVGAATVQMRTSTLLMLVLLLQLVKLPRLMHHYLIPEDADPALGLYFGGPGQRKLVRKGHSRRRLEMIDGPLVQYFGRCGLMNLAQPIDIGIALAPSIPCCAHRRLSLNRS